MLGPLAKPVSSGNKINASEIDALKQKNATLENEKGSLDGKVAELQSSVSSKDLDLKELSAAVSSLRSEDQAVLGETSLSFSLSVSHSRVEQIMANIAAERSALLDVWTPISELFSVPPIIVDDSEIVYADGQESSQGDAAMVEFEKEDLDTTPERDLLS
ncbi:hypothetical protein Tco_0059212 [Tanacetum coccineum]